MNFWLIKSEPFKYSWEQFNQDQQTFWDGVRNYQARNNLMAMELGDLCLFYHSNEGKEVVGVAEVVKTHYQDPTTAETAWVVVDVKPAYQLKNPVSLQTMKSDPRLTNMGLLRQPRLSVIALTKDEFDTVILLSNEPA
jgi:predicted RNA-binding protein with PUA-like domain